MVKLDGTEICVLDQFNFHGLIFNKKKTLIPYLQYWKRNAVKL